MSLNTKCVFWLSVQLFFETFLILRRTERDIIRNVNWSSCKVGPSPFGFWKNNQISNFANIRPVGAELLHPDGQTDITEAKSTNSLESHAWFTTSAAITHAQRHKIPTHGLFVHNAHVSPTDRQMDFVSTWRRVCRRLPVTGLLSSRSSDTGCYLVRFPSNRPSTHGFYESVGLVSSPEQASQMWMFRIKSKF